MGTKKSKVLRDKIAGAIYGFAIGDAMGATTEFMDKDEITYKFGKLGNIIGGGWLDLEAGQVTDDTQMSMCIMEVLMKTLGPLTQAEMQVMNSRKRKSLEDKMTYDIMLKFIQWYDSNPPDIGGQCRKAISYGKMMLNRTGWLNLDIFKKDIYDEKALGNGSLMRAMPCAILGLGELNIDQGALTHNNPLCSEIITGYSYLLKQLLVIPYLGFVLLPEVKELNEPTGYIKDTYENAVYWLRESKSFKEAIINAVNHGGDADTIAAITGSLAGAGYGYDEIPKEWLKKLDKNVNNFLKKFINFCFSYLQI